MESEEGRGREREGWRVRKGEGGRGSNGARGCECRPKHKDMWLVRYTHSRIHHHKL